MTLNAQPIIKNHLHHRRQTKCHLAPSTLLIVLTLAVTAAAESTSDAGSDDTAVDSGISETDDKRAPTVCLSPGHPSYEGDKCYEAIINRKVAYIVRVLLLREGYGVVMSTADLTEMELFSRGFDNEDEAHWEKLEVQTPEEKAEICNDAGADYIISIHHNFAYNPATNHTMVFYGMDDRYNPEHHEAKEWAELTALFLSRVMKTDRSKVYADMKRLGFPLGIFANSSVPAILTEGAFYSNPEERKRLNDDDYIELEAQAIVDAFHTHYQSMNE
jgi:N-acetylmuramoyl-L-alanine amidase